MVAEVVVQAAALVRRRRGNPGTGGGRGRGGRRGKGESGRSQALDSPTLLTNPHVAAALQEGPGQRGWSHQCRRGRSQRTSGRVDTHGFFQELLRPWAQIGPSHPSKRATQGAGAAVQFTVTEAHVAHQPDRTRGRQRQARRLTQHSTSQRTPPPGTRSSLTGNSISELRQHLLTDRHLGGGRGGAEGGLWQPSLL